MRGVVLPKVVRDAVESCGAEKVEVRVRQRALALCAPARRKLLHFRIKTLERERLACRFTY